MPAASPLSSQPHWARAGAVAGAGHMLIAAAVLTHSSAHDIAPPPPVMVVELPMGMAPAAPQVPETPQIQEAVQPLPNMVPPEIDVPEVDTPFSADPVVIPPPAPIPQRLISPPPQPQPNIFPATPAPQPVSAAASTARGNAGDGPGDNPRAQEAANDWYALISAHLERNKRYPRAARREDQQGTPMVRFSVDRRGRVTNVSISQSSGHELLDEATISLMRRVSPLPAMPRAMQRDTVTLNLPIEYSLGRK